MSEEILKDFRNFIDGNINCELFFVTQNKEEYKTIQPNIDSTLINNKLLSETISLLKNNVNDRKIVEFNNEYDSKDELMIISKSEVENASKVLHSLKNVTQHEFKDGFTFRDIKFHSLKLKGEKDGSEEVAYLFKKYRQSSLLTNEKFLKFLKDSSGKLIESKEDVIVLDTHCDVILYKDVLFVLNRNPFEQIFNYKDEYIKQRDRILKLVESEKGLFFSTSESFDKFQEYCNDARYQKKFKAIEDNDGVKVLKENMYRLPSLNKQFAFEFDLDKDNKIICNKKEALADILDLLSGKLVLWALNDEPREAAMTTKR